MYKSPCIMWWQGAPCEVSMTENAYQFVFYHGDGIAKPAELLKSVITNMKIDARKAYVGQELTFNEPSAIINGAIFGWEVGVLEAVGTLKERPKFKNRWFLTIEANDGVIELEFDYSTAYSASLFKQSVSTFLRDFKKRRKLYAREQPLEAAKQLQFE